MLSKMALNELVKYIHGVSILSDQVLLELKTIAIKTPVTVYRGLSFETKEEFFEQYGKELYINYKIKSGESFSLDIDEASLFAQDIYSNYGVLLELTLEVPYLDISQLPEEFQSQVEDFSHEQELLSLDEAIVKAKIVKVYKDTQKKIGLK